MGECVTPRDDAELEFVRVTVTWMLVAKTMPGRKGREAVLMTVGAYGHGGDAIRQEVREWLYRERPVGEADGFLDKLEAYRVAAERVDPDRLEGLSGYAEAAAEANAAGNRQTRRTMRQYREKLRRRK